LNAREEETTLVSETGETAEAVLAKAVDMMIEEEEEGELAIINNLESREESARIFLSERKFYYEGPRGQRLSLLPSDAPIPDFQSDFESWDVWEINNEGEMLTREAIRMKMKVGPPISMSHGWDITNKQHQDYFLKLQEQYKPQLIAVSSVLRPWGTSAPRKVKAVREWLADHDLKHIRFIANLFVKQAEGKRDCVIEMPQGSAVLDYKEI
jgi:hypothetical protein